MKNRKWRKIIAFTASVAMLVNTGSVYRLPVGFQGFASAAEADGILLDEELPNIQQDDGVEADSAGNFLEGTFLEGTEFLESGADGFPEITIEGSEIVSEAEAERAAGGSGEVTLQTQSERMTVDIRLTQEKDAIQKNIFSQEQKNVQWMHVAARDISQSSSGEAQVRIYLTDKKTKRPPEHVTVLLFETYTEHLEEKNDLLPVKLKKVLNGAENLEIVRCQEYEKNEKGEYILNGNKKIVAEDYLTFTLPAAGHAEFSVAFVYKTAGEEIYSLDAKAEAVQVTDGLPEDILYKGYTDKRYDNEMTLVWDSCTEEFYEAAMTTGCESWITGAEGKDHSWGVLENGVITILETDGAIVRLEAGETGEAYLAHTYQVDEAYRMETFHVTVSGKTEAERETFAETGTESGGLTETEAEYEQIDQTEALTEPETGLLTETIDAETEVSTETTETETSMELETEVSTEKETETSAELETELSTEMIDAETTTEQETEFSTEIETETSTELETEVSTEKETETSTESDMEEQSEPESMTELEPETLTEIESEPESEDESETEIETETESETESETAGEQSEEKPIRSTVRITLTKELEETEALQDGQGAQDGLWQEDDVPEDYEAEILLEDEAENKAEILLEDQAENIVGDSETVEPEASEATAEEVKDTAVSGQAYFVHVQAEDVQPDAAYDSVVKLRLVDMGVNVPAVDVQTAVFRSKEEAVQAQPSQSVTLADAVHTRTGTEPLLVSRVQETASDTETITDDYLQFDLPAGSSTDFYVGVTYTTGADTYEKQVLIDAEALQYFPVLSEPSGDKVQQSEAQADEQSESKNQINENSEAVAEEQAVNVLAAQAQETMTWSAARAPQAQGGSRFTPQETKILKRFLEEHPGYVLLDTEKFTKNNTDWNSKAILYCSIHENPTIWLQSSSVKPGVDKVYAWNLDEKGNKDSCSANFGYADNWSANNANHFYKAQTKTVSEMKGKLFAAAGSYWSDSGDDKGKEYYTITEELFAQSPLSGKRVYLDTTDIDGMNTPFVKMTEPDGEVRYQEMALCAGEIRIYSYNFDAYVLPDTTFQFVDASEISQEEQMVIPGEPVSDFSTSKPCYDGMEWVTYVPKINEAKLYVRHDFSEGVQIVYTKNGIDTGKIWPTDGSQDNPYIFEFDLYSEEYDGFYIRERNNTKEGNKTILVSREDIQAAAAMYDTAELNAWVGGWIEEQVRRHVSLTRYGSDGDSSLHIPVGRFERDPNLLYITSTFYDYYSDEELSGRNRKDLNGFDHAPGSKDKLQARNFNAAISDYFAGTTLVTGNGRQSPLYFGEFTQASTSDLNRFIWENNNGEPNRVNGKAGARQGLADQSLGADGQLTMSGIPAPYFNESFLRGNNLLGTNIGYVFPEVAFPFVKNSSGYWEFNSYDSSQTLRMKLDPSGSYFLDRVGEKNAVHGFTSTSVTANSNFFPFNGTAESGKTEKLNYAFGARLDIPFYMTSDGQVEMNGKKENIVFQFSGDDDIWIYIDGQLVLDIGGDHGAVDGKIDFHECKATTTTNGGWGCLGADSSFAPLDSSKEHTLTMFYMERGLWESNMKITFNFPQSNELEIEKEVVIPRGVNSWFSAAVQSLHNIEFPVSVKNLVASGPEVGVDSVQPAVERAADLITGGTSASLANEKWSAVCAVGSGGGRNEVLQYYYPGRKNYLDPQSVTDSRSIYIDVNVSLTGVEEQVSKYGYIQLDTYAESSATEPFIALMDGNGNRIGGWASGCAYDSASRSMGDRTWKTLKISVDKLRQVSGSSFDYGNIRRIQFAYHDAVKIYLDNIYIKAPAQYAKSTGFTKDDKVIPDYGSVASRSPMEANGAEYLREGTDRPSHMTDGHVYLKNGDKVTFSDQFRRKSYLCITEDVDASVFDTAWILYENGLKEKSGAGVSVDDGRTSSGPYASAPELPTRKPQQSILFSSRENSLTDYFVKTVKYVNTLKLGNIRICKLLQEGQQDDGREYTFELVFSNVAGMKLEGEVPITKRVRVKAGAEHAQLLSGIPAGTQYTIREIKEAEDSFTLIDVKTEGNDHAIVDTVLQEVTGSIVADGTEADTFTFINDVNESIEIAGTKLWDAVPEDAIPSDITLRLERKLAGAEDSTYERARDMQEREIADLVVRGDTDWKFLFQNVPKYNGTGSGRQEYVYRVVELKAGDTEVENTRFLWSGGTAVTADGQTEPVYDITNTYRPLTDLSIRKTDSTDPDRVLGGVVFKLEKASEDAKIYTQIGTDVTTGTDGRAVFSGLEDGVYRLTEIKAAAGYSLLKAPIVIVLDRTPGGTCTVDGVPFEADQENVLTITVQNRRKFLIPATGSWSRYILIFAGLILSGTAILMYLLRRRRKEGTAS